MKHTWWCGCWCLIFTTVSALTFNLWIRHKHTHALVLYMKVWVQNALLLYTHTTFLFIKWNLWTHACAATLLPSHVVSACYLWWCHHLLSTPQWGAADAEIKVPSGENTELKRSPFKAWSRSVYSHTCYAYCQELLPRLFLPFRSIHLHFFQNLSQFFPVLAVANTGSCVGPQNKIGHPVGCRFPCWLPAEYK